jgi:hypothetical protein
VLLSLGSSSTDNGEKDPEVDLKESNTDIWGEREFFFFFFFFFGIFSFRISSQQKSILKRTALFWVNMHQVLVIYHQRFGTNYRSQNVGKKLPLLAK